MAAPAARGASNMPGTNTSCPLPPPSCCAWPAAAPACCACCDISSVLLLDWWRSSGMEALSRRGGA